VEKLNAIQKCFGGKENICVLL